MNFIYGLIDPISRELRYIGKISMSLMGHKYNKNGGRPQRIFSNIEKRDIFNKRNNGMLLRELRKEYKTSSRVLTRILREIKKEILNG